jgi:hypothetical protein
VGHLRMTFLPHFSLYTGLIGANIISCISPVPSFIGQPFPSSLPVSAASLVSLGWNYLRCRSSHVDLFHSPLPG